ncbi:BALANCE of CHLOROPHYLL METABOLISM 1 [Hibiscus trionum]|uniref:BALANCE of CHLOROPHYLL METABOLISM 1 n=1 Tax=Hibiscus trionum TaxID=183268 RepID=A0A9W7JBU4_HIBTR|nr:BALANCE of CHLOROPHYLL METABOLISM 1 [Hibiscus trionum]
MEIPILSLSSKTTPYLGSCCVSSSNSNVRLLCEFGSRKRRMSIRCAKASVESSGEAAIKERESFTGSAMGVTTLDQSFTEDFPVWDKIGAVVRLSYGIGIYGAMALAGRFICSVTGIDSTGGFHPSFDAILEGLGYAAPPIMALLFILDDEVVKLSPHARAIRDVEDEELRSFFYGMSPWQFILIVAASSVGEELFYRAAVQGALADIFLRGTELVSDARGMASLTGVLPPFVPFAQAFAAVITAALTGSLYYVAASPKDPTYVVAPVQRSGSAREDLKKLFAAWYERRQMKKIYSPLLEGILALYLGFEWIETNNILAPIITHGIYSATILGHGLWKIHDHRRRLRQRIQQLKSEGKKSNKL